MASPDDSPPSPSVEYTVPADIEPFKNGTSADSSSTGTTLIWKDLTVTVPLPAGKSGDPDAKPKDILHGVSGYVEPGDVLYIMGPSGSGKTTLLDALAGRLKLTTHGVQQLDNELKTSRALKKVSKYVQQTDDLLGVLSVRESLSFSAQLYGVPNHAQVVDSTIDLLGLSAAKHTKVGNVFMKGLSGGQKRRVSIAQELVAGPQLLFLDEPTSGLDAATAFHVVTELKRVAERMNVAVVVSVHQPSEVIFEMASKLLLVAGGKTVYFGPANDAVSYFERCMAASKPSTLSDVEWMLELVNSDYGSQNTVDQLHAQWTNSKHNAQLSDYLQQNIMDEAEHQQQKTVQPPQSKSTVYGTSLLNQIRILTHRGMLNVIRNPAVLWLRFAMYLMLAIMIGLVWLRLPTRATSIVEMNSAIFYICAFMIFMSISVLPAYLEEREILSRERANTAYSSTAYMIAHTLYELPFLFVLSLACSAVVYFLVGLTPQASRFIIFVLNLFVSLFVAESLMVLISAVVPIIIVGIAAGAMVFGIFMCVMGLFVPINDIGWWIRWIRYGALHYFSYSTFLVNQHKGVIYDAVPQSVYPPFPNDVPGEDVYRQIGLEERLWVNFVVQIAMAVVYRVLATLWIQRYVKGKK